MEEDIEVWKDVPEYEGVYQVSNLGKLRSIERLNSRGCKVKGRILSQHYSHKGYIIVALCKNNIRTTTSIHRLIAQAFIPNPENKPQINHINGIKDDNRLENIEWVTQEENMRHAYNTGLKEGFPGEKNGRAISSNKEIEELRDRYNNGEKASEIAKSTGLKLMNVREILFGKTWSIIDKKIEKRDDRKTWSGDHSKNSLISRFINKGESAIKVVGQYTKDGIEIGRYRSINRASIQTGVPRKSIEAVVNKKMFFRKDGSYYIMETAGDFKWELIKLSVELYKELL